MSTSVREELEHVTATAHVGGPGKQYREDREEDTEKQSLGSAYAHLAAGLVERAAARCERGGAWPQRIRAGLEALLEELAARPEVARAVMRSLPAVGPAGYASYVGFLEAFVPFLAEGRAYAEAGEELPEEIEMLAIGSAETIVVGEIDAGRTAALPALLPDILFSVLVPFVGPEEAAAAMEEARAARPRRS